MWGENANQEERERVPLAVGRPALRHGRMKASKKSNNVGGFFDRGSERG